VVLGFILFRRWINRLGIPRLMPARKPVRPEATAGDQR